MTIPFIDLHAQRDRIRDRLDAAMARVLDHGGFIMGPEVGAFETQLAEFCGVPHALGCANGTDALQLVLMAEGIGPGDAVFVPAFTFVASAEVVPLMGATPVFVDVDEATFNISAASLKSAIQTAKAEGLNPRLVIAVDLFGLPADYALINAIAKDNRLVVLADSAQGLGGSIGGKRSGSLADWTTTSFFPAKPLGCYGDGGAVMCADDEKAALIKSLRIHGKGGDKYDNVRIGINSRLDTLQAAILIEKLAIFEDEIERRNVVAQRYAEGLGNAVRVPHVPDGYGSSWAQYTVQLENRADVSAKLREAGIPTAVYYPIPMHKQSGYLDYPVAENGLAVSESLSANVLSLPMHPYIQQGDQDHVIAEVLKAVGAQ